MSHHTSVSVLHITGEDEVRLERCQSPEFSHNWLELPGNVTMFFEGFGVESEANLLGFLDQMHAIRNAVLQDRADRAEAVR